MSVLSTALARIKPSPTIAMSSLASSLRQEGRDIISLSAGEPDFDTPDHIKAAAIAAIEAGKTKYTPPDGMPELKAAICDKFARDNDLSYEPKHISVGTGGKQILYNALVASLNPGDEVVIPAPYWVSYPDMVLLAGGTPVIAETRAENNYKLTAKNLRAALSSATKWFIFNSPSNPTGAGYSEAELRALTDVLLEFPNVWVMSDDMYEHLAFDGFRFCTPAQVEPQLYERTLTCNGVSKAYAMTGWRIGYSVWPESLIDLATRLCINDHSCVNAATQYAAMEALTGPQGEVDTMVAAFDERRGVIVEELNSIPGFECPMPGGAFYTFPNITGTGKSSRELQDLFLEKVGVATVSGTSFGEFGEGYLRFSYANSTDNIREAVRRIKEVLG